LSKPRRVILIGHEDCRWYLDARFLHVHQPGGERQLADLRDLRAQFAERFPAVTVESYFARLDGDEAAFERVS